VTLNQTALELRRQLVSARLDPDRLQPWPAWKVFKDFARREVGDVYDVVSFQFSVSDTESGAEAPTMFWVRQFTERHPDSEEDELLGSLIVEFQYGPLDLRSQDDAEIWSLDFPDLDQWASVVEGLPQFQDALNGQPTLTSVYYEEA
jgi:hypothetical protein